VTFVEYRNEGGADFVAWAEANPTAALRRYQVRDTGKPRALGPVNGDQREEVATYQITVAYPQDGRFGDDGALDRDDAMRADQLAFERQFGPLGAANFSPPFPDATWRSMTVARKSGNGVDFLVMTMELSYVRRFGAVAAVDVVTSLPTTVSALRSRARALVAAIVPTVMSDDRLIEYRNEGGADFRAWARANPTAAFRRWQLRDTGDDQSPSMQNTDLEARTIAFTLIVAYPQDERAGDAAALSRDDLALADETLIRLAIGVEGYANWTGADNPNATVIGYAVDRESDPTGVDFLAITLRLAYRRAV
jgi:hypothetical protein